MATVFCDPDVIGGSVNGTSWEDAYTSFQTAYDAAGAGDEVWIKARTITLTVLIDIDNANTPTVYGGFDIALTGTSGSVAGRTAGARTILDGNNLYQCMLISVSNILDGIKLINGDSVLAGGMEVDGSGIDVVFRNFEVWDCAGETAGGLWLSSADTVLFDNCVFDGNVQDNGTTNSSYGGAIYMGANSTVVTCTDTIFNENTASLDGGAIYSDASNTLVCTDCTFTANSATATSGYVDGGCIYNYQAGDMTFTRCKFLNNTANYSYGGAFFLWDATVDFVNCVLAGNTADVGGAIATYGTNYVTLTNCTIADNSCASASSGGAFNDDGYTLVNCILYGNTADGSPDQYYGTISATYSNVEGGESGTGNVNDDPLFKQGGDDPYDLAGSSGAVDSGNAGATEYVSTDILGRSRVDDSNTSNTGSGSPAYSDMGAYEFQIPSMYFVDTSAVGGNNGSSWENAFDDLQEAIDYVAYANIELWIKARTITQTARIDLDNSNEPDLYGGFATSLTGTDGSVVGRTAGVRTTLDAVDTYIGMQTSYGGIIDGIKFLNGATSPGAVNIAGSATPDLAFKNCDFIDGTTTYRGSVYQASAVTTLLFEDCTFSGNTGAQRGGALHLAFAGTHTITRCTFEDNESTIQGAAIQTYAACGPVTFTDCVFDNNNMNPGNYGAGGCLHLQGDNNHTFLRCYFKNNTATAASCFGNLYFDECGGTNLVTDCVVENNSSYYAGAFCLTSSTIVFTGCTMADNTSTASGYPAAIRNRTGGVSTIVNCNIWGNISGSSASQITTTGSTVTYSNVEDGEGGTGGGTNLEVDPNFIGSGDDPYDLGTTSDIVDAANSGATYYNGTDYLGRTRSGPSMGAYEFQTTVSEILGSLLLAFN